MNLRGQPALDAQAPVWTNSAGAKNKLHREATTGPQTGTLPWLPVTQTMWFVAPTMSLSWLSGPLPSSSPSSQRMQSTTFTPMSSAMNRPPVVTLNTWTSSASVKMEIRLQLFIFCLYSSLSQTTYTLPTGFFVDQPQV